MLDGTRRDLNKHRKDSNLFQVEVHLKKSVTEENVALITIILDITAQESCTQNLEQTVAKRTQR